jgi:small subunit ribosomal protein S2
LFLGTKKQAREAVKKAALACESPFITTRWIGGTFTNYENISKLFARLKELERGFESGEWKKYTKKEQVTMDKEMQKLQSFVGGIKDMNKLPKAVFVVDIKKEQTAVAEANKRGIPVIALVDTNVNPESVQYPIPANDDAVKSIEMIAMLLADAVSLAKKAKVQS